MRPALVVVACITAASLRAETWITIVDDIPGAGRLAAPATGQTLYVLDERARTVTAIDPVAPAKRWRAIGPADLDDGTAEVRPTAIACVDSNTLAVVCRRDTAWSLKVFRLAPPGADQAGPQLRQSLGLGDAPAAAESIDVFVSDTRDWLAVVGLPAPLPRFLRAPIAGSRLGGFSERLCPPMPPADRIAAATSSPFDEWVVFVFREGEQGGRTRVALFANDGSTRLLDLAIGLAGVRDVAYSRGNGTLWVVADGGGPGAKGSGLWRIDAAIEAGRQVAVPVAVASLADPLSVVCLSDRAVAVSCGGEHRRVVIVNPVQPTTP